MKKQCIKWAERDDLEAVAIQIIYQMKDCTGVFRDYENHFYIGKVPPERYGIIQTLFFSDWFNRANEQAIKSKELFYSGMNIIPLSRLPDEILNIVLERRRFTEHPNSPEYILQTIIKTLEEKDEIKAGLSAPPASQPNQEAQPRAVRPKRNSPKQTQAGGGSSEQPRKYFKFPKDKKERIEFLCSILRDLRDGLEQGEISKKYGFDETLWTKPGKKWGLGQYLPKLKERALLYAQDNKERLKQRANKGDYLDFDDPIENADWLFCAALLDELHETELDPKKDINRREVPMGQLNDRGKWE